MDYETHLQEQKERHVSLLEDTVIEQTDIINSQRAEIQQQKNTPFAQLLAQFICFFESVKAAVLVPFSLTEEQQTEWYHKILRMIEPKYVTSFRPLYANRRFIYKIGKLNVTIKV